MATASSTPKPTPPDSQIDNEVSLSYWSGVSADVNGMLGGYPQVSRIDLQGSRNFIAKVNRLLTIASATHANGTSSKSSTSTTSSPAKKRKLRLGVDCGAGIGRITQGLLVDVCEVVDIVEPVEKFSSVLEQGQLAREGRVGDVYTLGLELWQPSKKYDLIWNQWCVGHLTDAQLVDYLRRARDALTVAEDGHNAGWMCVKENLSTEGFGEDLYDDVDSSVTRSDAKFRQIFDEAGLELIRAELQTGFPKSLGLFPVKMYALRPK